MDRTSISGMPRLPCFVKKNPDAEFRKRDMLCPFVLLVGSWSSLVMVEGSILFYWEKKEKERERLISWIFWFLERSYRKTISM